LLYKLRAKCAGRDKVSKNQSGKSQNLNLRAAAPDADLPSLKQRAKTLCSAKSFIQIALSPGRQRSEGAGLTEHQAAPLSDPALTRRAG
jgi:hypothetical protein